MTGRYQENEKKRKELEKEKLSSDLAFLKSQVSPHFFFNTLNNIYSLTEINTKEAQNAILQLSKLMRYLLYDSEKGETKLSSEINFMKNYIELMRLRLSDKVSLTFSFPEEYNDIDFPPLLFISFIENAFKHGISYREPSNIHIGLQQQNDAIHFICKNSIGRKNENGDESGIGLDNIKKRLALLFPDNHQLSIVQTEKTFEVDLMITIKG
jgi:LytS/YehU family sensor histidine kinase